MDKKTKRHLIKYGILLILYAIFSRYIVKYGLQIYFTHFQIPDWTVDTTQNVQNILNIMNFTFGLIIFIILIFDVGKKNLLSWIILILAFFQPELGIILFLIRELYYNIAKLQSPTRAIFKPGNDSI